ncbi:hypothetical protein LTR53_004833 [Teratosphaeriaceae sp. CCFEE 6253]|nr:hypothetical protein LTR53_004833 [Teratosphaeriaceae sp. CCFEE 6253]
MSTIGDLTKSGLLYEGNYLEWVDRVVAMLKIHGVQFAVFDATREAPKYLGVSWSTRMPLFAKMITDQINPPMARRLSLAGSQDPKIMLRELRTLAKPFPLIKLPLELRRGPGFGHSYGR